MPHQIGERVGAISHSADGETYYVFGFGVFEGDHVPPEGIVGLAGILHDTNVANPRIRLDSGKIVFGCECWWGSEARIRAEIEGKRVVEIDIDDARERVRDAWAREAGMTEDDDD